VVADTVAEPGGISVTAYARLRGVARWAVQQRIEAGSLPTAAKRIKGKWVIDPTKADAEWAAHTQPRVAAGSIPSGLAAATQREREARANSIELDIARKTRELVPSREVDLRWSGLVVAARTKLLGLPSRYKQRVPHATVADLGVLEALIREALEELVHEEPKGESR
jgi:phage terminase Nu1 subunit (DNA packaging protein)